MGRYLKLGALAGIAGGVALALFLLLVGEDSIGDAIALEEAAAGHGGSDAPFTRGAQMVGGALGSLFVGAALGAVFGVVFAATRHRLPGRDDWRRAMWLAGAAFVSIQLVPALKYPANPPAVGDPDTVDRRTLLFLLLVAFTIVATVAATRLRRWLDGRGLPEHAAVTAAVVAWLVMVGLALALFPPPPDPVRIPADLAWRFRLASIGGVAAFWATTGTVFGWLLLTVGRPSRPRQPVG